MFTLSCNFCAIVSILLLFFIHLSVSFEFKIAFNGFYSYVLFIFMVSKRGLDRKFHRADYTLLCVPFVDMQLIVTCKKNPLKYLIGQAGSYCCCVEHYWHNWC